MARLRRGGAWLRPHAPAALVALGALAIAWAFAATVLRHTRPMGLPLDDSYIYLTYAKQFGRGEPFSYFPGGGYSAGAPSVLWPMVLAPFWALGARGHALVWVSFLVCAALYAATLVGVHRIARRIAGALPALVAAVVLLGIAPFAWTALSGMEVALASALLVALLGLLLEQPRTGRPSKRLLACLAALSLTCSAALLLVGAIVGLAVVARLRQRDLRSATWWLVPLVAPGAWLLANLLLAGQLLPNTGVARSHFYLPGFDWTYWREAVWSAAGQMLRGLFWDGASPLVWPRVVAALWLIGAVRVGWWAHRARQGLVGAVLVLGPPVLLLAVIASSGMWSFQNHRYIAPAFALLAIPVGVALAPVRDHRWARRAALVVGLAFALGFARAAVPGLRIHAQNFAQGAMDTNTQVVAIGRYLRTKLPGAAVLLHDAGAIAYHGDGPVLDMLGLVTNHQAGITAHGPGTRFEFLESLPPERRPTHFASYPTWLGTDEFFGEVLLHTLIRRGFAPGRHVGAASMQLIVANWDHVGTGDRPLVPHPGWALVDRLDSAHLASERAHAWRGALGRRREPGDPSARWSLLTREVGAHGLVLDGGRTIGGAREAFTVAIDPTRPTRLVLRTGGPRHYPQHPPVTRPVTVEVRTDDGGLLATATLPAPTGGFVEVPFALPAGTPPALRIEASGPYRAYHWFVLQPE